MSVKLMTTDQLHNDLASIHNMWAGGVPSEQTDRVNALKAELKRRGDAPRLLSQEGGAPAPKLGLEAMNDEQLSKTLLDLSERISRAPGDDGLQEQFANVRFELRKRAKNGNGAQNTTDSQPAGQFDPVTGESKVTGAFDPVTGETFKSQLANNGSFQEGAVSRRTTEMPSQRRIEVMQKEENIRQDAAAQQRMEEFNNRQDAMMRKHTVAQLAGKIAASLITNHEDPNGDDVETACLIGVQMANSIAAKVGL